MAAETIFAQFVGTASPQQCSTHLDRASAEQLRRAHVCVVVGVSAPEGEPVAPKL